MVRLLNTLDAAEIFETVSNWINDGVSGRVITNRLIEEYDLTPTEAHYVIIAVENIRGDGHKHNRPC